jgi:hypothetical protein
MAVLTGLKQPWPKAVRLFPTRVETIMACTRSALPLMCLYAAFIANSPLFYGLADCLGVRPSVETHDQILRL